MLGAIIGDIVGSKYEFNNIRTKNFELFSYGCDFTDDSVMTVAIAKAILDCEKDYHLLSQKAIENMRRFGVMYPHRGYGERFAKWLYSDKPQPYNSCGNGSAMRVSACGFAGKSLADVIALSHAVTEVTHNHPEGIKGAEATAVAIFLAKSGENITYIRRYICENYYNIDFTLNDIRRTYHFGETCQTSVPQAMEAFFESCDFEDAIRNAISIGGDSDTIAAIAGGIAEAYYGIPESIQSKARRYLDMEMQIILNEFETCFQF